MQPLVRFGQGLPKQGLRASDSGHIPATMISLTRTKTKAVPFLAGDNTFMGPKGPSFQLKLNSWFDNIHLKLADALIFVQVLIPKKSYLMKSFRQQKTIEGLDSLTDWKIKF